MQPASNAFLDGLAAFQLEKRYPLRAKVCEICKLVQVDYDVAPQELFGNYVYFSSYSDDWLAHAKAYCEMAPSVSRWALSLGGGIGQQRRLSAEEFLGDGHTRVRDRSVRHGGRCRGKNRRADPGGIFRPKRGS